MSNLNEIATFVRVVDSGSFTAAADALEVSKAAVSKAVTRLEARLGSRLLQRTTRRLTLTEAGEALYHGARRALSDLDAAEADVQALTGRPRGRLRVTVPVLVATEFLAPRLPEFERLYPEIVLDLDLDNRFIDLVSERFDLAIRLTTLSDSTLVARRLAEVRVVTCATPDYLDRHGTPETPAALRDHRCLAYSLDRTPSDWHYRRDDGTTETVRVAGPMRSNSDPMLKRMALANLGFVRMPELFLRDELADGRLIEVLAPYAMPPITLAAVFPTRAHLPPKTRVFVDFVARWFA